MLELEKIFLIGEIHQFKKIVKLLNFLKRNTEKLH